MKLSISLNVAFGKSDERTGTGALSNAKVIVTKNGTSQTKQSFTDNKGEVTFELDKGTYTLEFPNLPKGWEFPTDQLEILVNKDVEETYKVKKTSSGLALEAIDATGQPITHITQGQGFWIKVTSPDEITDEVKFYAYKGTRQNQADTRTTNKYVAQVLGSTDTADPITFGADVLLKASGSGEDNESDNNIIIKMLSEITVVENKQIIGGGINSITSLTRTETTFTEDTAFWTAIRNSTDALSFNKYSSFMDSLFCGGSKDDEHNRSGNNGSGMFGTYNKLKAARILPFTDTDAYRVLKVATEAFVMVNCGNLIFEECDNAGNPGVTLPFNIDTGPKGDNAYLGRRDLPIPPNSESLCTSFYRDYLENADGNGKILPYLAVIRRKLPDIPIIGIKNGQRELNLDADVCYGLLQEKLANPCLLELIWSYWHEEGMLVQTSNAITRRFQNVRSSSQDPLASMEMDPLRPLNNLLWGYIQDEQHRLTVNRRNYEYDHHYGLRLEGKAVQNFQPADTRSKFLEAFHHLLRLCTVFYKQDDDTTVKADAFPVLNALKEVHLILSQGAHNQFGDLPSTARIEMLMQQWMLARPEFRELLPTRVMVAYPEPWMDRVDAMKKLQGWTDTSVLHFRNLGMFGEQLLLSIRWGHWSDEFEPVKALNWARFFRPQVQGYIHAYRAATGVDLSADPTVSARVDSTLPSVLLQKRLASQQRAI